MKSYFKNSVVFVALAALSFIYKSLAWHFVGTLLALLALSKIVYANRAKFVPLKNVLKTLLLLNCATCATCATY